MAEASFEDFKNGWVSGTKRTSQAMADKLQQLSNMSRVPDGFHPAVASRIQETHPMLIDSQCQSLYSAANALEIYKQIGKQVLEEINLLEERGEPPSKRPCVGAGITASLSNVVLDRNEDVSEEQIDESTLKIAGQKPKFVKLVRQSLADGVIEVLAAHQHAVTNIISNTADCVRSLMNVAVSNLLGNSLEELTEAPQDADENTIEATPVDAVVTWVNEADPTWSALLKTQLQKCRNAAADATHARRFQCSGEIVVCIESMLKFAPWIRKIFLVVASKQQVESGPVALQQALNDSAGRIQIVTHAEFMDKNALPTFNSLAIESRFHKIEDLSEFFIKFDDDMILGRPLAKSDVLGVMDGSVVMKISLSSSAKDDFKNYTIDSNSLWRRMAAANIKRIEAYRKSKTLVWTSDQHKRLITHGPQIMSKSILNEMVDVEFKADAMKTQQNRFRSNDDLMTVCLVGHHIALMTNRAIVTWDNRESFMMVPVAKWNNNLALDLETILRDPPRSFCVNNSIVADNDDSIPLLQEFLADFKKYGLYLELILGTFWMVI